MSQAHDYYHEGFPALHNIGENAAYIEPDYIANHADDQLPLLSTMGRGPQGEGLYIGNIVTTDDTVSFALYSTLTGELVWQSPNLAPANISFKSSDWRDLVPGVHADLDIIVSRGGVTETHTAYIPAGQVGSLVYLLKDVVPRSKDDTYRTTISELTIYGREAYQNKPIPRPNDIVFFTYKGSDEYGIAFGTIEDVGGTTRETKSSKAAENSTQVVFTARTFIPIPSLTIGSNGHWVVAGTDTGINAQGDKGDKGDKGDTGAQGPKGEKGDTGARGPAGANATVKVVQTVQLGAGANAYVKDTDPSDSNAALEFGIPRGLPASIPEVGYTILEPDEEGSVTIEQTSSANNEYKLNINLPRGTDGAPLDLQHGIWKVTDLPEFDETPINTAFVVDDEDGYMDLYVRGRIAHDAEDGGPWTVVEDWFRFDQDMSYLDLKDKPLDKDDDGNWVADGDMNIWESIADKPDFADIATSGSYNDLVDTPDLHRVATSGDYNDLNQKPLVQEADGLKATDALLSPDGDKYITATELDEKCEECKEDMLENSLTRQEAIDLIDQIFGGVTPIEPYTLLTRSEASNMVMRSFTGAAIYDTDVEWMSDENAQAMLAWIYQKFPEVDGKTLTEEEAMDLVDNIMA